MRISTPWIVTGSLAALAAAGGIGAAVAGPAEDRELTAVNVQTTAFPRTTTGPVPAAPSTDPGDDTSAPTPAPVTADPASAPAAPAAPVEVSAPSPVEVASPASAASGWSAESGD